MKFIQAIICVLSLLWCVACGHFYQGVQAYNVSSCYELEYSERQQCLERVEGSYEQYRQDRNAAIPDQDDNEEQPLNY